MAGVREHGSGESKRKDYPPRVEQRASKRLVMDLEFVCFAEKQFSTYRISYQVCLYYAQATSRSERLLARENVAKSIDGPNVQVQTGDLEMPNAPCSKKTTPTTNARI